MDRIAYTRLPAPLLALAAGMLGAAGFAPLGWWPLTLIALAILYRLTEGTGWRRAALLGWAFGVGHFAFGLNWIAGAFRYQDAMPVWFGYGAVILLSLYLAVFPALAAALSSRFAGPARVPAFAAAWIASEMLRASLFTGFAWNPLAAILTARVEGGVPLQPLLALLGTYATGGVLALAAALLARRVAWGIAAIGAIWLSALAHPAAPPPTGRRVLIVQPNTDQADKYTAPERNMAALEALSRRRTAAPTLILWPEAATLYFLEEEGYARARLAALLRPGDLMLTGGDALIRDARGEVTGGRNAVFALRPDGHLAGRYDKAHLVPYGEYLPMRPLLSAVGLSRLVPGDVDFRPGPGPAALEAGPWGRIGIQICYEIIFSGRVVDRAARPAALFNPSNDAWFGLWGPPQHLAQARLRAAEEGLPVLRATPTGISAVIDATGALRGMVPLGTAGTVEAPLPSPLPPTAFARARPLIPAALAILLAVAAVAMRRRRR